MKRKTDLENPEVEEKKGRISNGNDGSPTHPSRAQKCSICLWPVGAPQCYHAATNHGDR